MSRTPGVWEIRVCGYDPDRPKHQLSRRYTIIAREYSEASAQAKRLAELDGLLPPVLVWAATRLRDAPEFERPKYLTDSKGTK